MCRRTHRVYPRGGEGAPDRHRAVRRPLRQFRRRADQRRDTAPGSNRVEGSILGHLESSDLTGIDADGSRAAPSAARSSDSPWAHPSFATASPCSSMPTSNREVTPQTVPVPVPAATRQQEQSATRAWCVSETSCGATAWTRGASRSGTYSTPSRNLFFKVTAQLGLNSRLAVSHNYGHGNDRREIGERDDPGLYGLSSSGSQSPETINATRLAWTTAFGARFTNQMVAGAGGRPADLPSQLGLSRGVPGGQRRSRAVRRRRRAPRTARASRPGIRSGRSPTTSAWRRGTIGSPSGPMPSGSTWWRTCWTSPAASGPSVAWTRWQRARRRVTYGTSPPRATRSVAFRVNQIGVYAQDQWVPTPHLTVTAGLRLDVPFVPTPPTCNLKAWNELGINTSLTPSGNALWSPRLGVNYDPSGRGTTVLRGGVGFFAGPPAYVWYRNVYGTAGIRALRIDCEGDARAGVHPRPEEPTHRLCRAVATGLSSRLLRSRLPVSPQSQGGPRYGSGSTLGRRGHGGFPVHSPRELGRDRGREPARAGRALRPAKEAGCSTGPSTSRPVERHPVESTDGDGQSRPAAERQRRSLVLGHGPTRASTSPAGPR